MKETLLVKHAVGGRTFIDTGKQFVEYHLEKVEEKWHFVIKIPFGPIVKEILTWKDELNVFLFHEFENQPTKKTWYYVKDGPVTYNEQQQELTIVAHSRIEYVPDEFGFSV